MKKGMKNCYADGGKYESAKTMKDEVKFMKKGGAPKSLVKHEMDEHAKMKKMANGGKVAAADRKAGALKGKPFMPKKG